MKRIIIATVFCLFSVSLIGQDMIVKKNGDEIKALVLEVATSEIKYKKFDNQEGPTYTIDKKDVFMIRYENGTKDVFSSNSASTSNAPTYKPSAKKNTNTANDLPRASFNINPLGLLQFGPIFQYEAKIGERSYIAPHFRYAFAGALTHVVWTGFEEDSELSAGTAAVGLGIKGFAETSGNTWYYGGILDLGWATARYDIGESSESEEKATTLSVLSNAGYRWRSSRGSYINVGIFLGIASDLSAEETFFNSVTVEDTAETNFFGMLELSFGWEYK